MITLNYDDYICVKLAFSETQMLSIIPAPSGKFDNKMCGNYSNNCHTNVLFTETSYLPRAWGCFPLQMKLESQTAEEVAARIRDKGDRGSEPWSQRLCLLKTLQTWAQEDVKKEEMGIWAREVASVLYHHNKWPLEHLPSSQNQREWMESNFPILGPVSEGPVAALEVE